MCEVLQRRIIAKDLPYDLDELGEEKEITKGLMRLSQQALSNMWLASQVFFNERSPQVRSDQAFSAAFRQSGIILVRDYEQMFNLARAISIAVAESGGTFINLPQRLCHWVLRRIYQETS